MLARFLQYGKVNDYENYRSKPYKETESGVGVYRTLRLPSFHAITQPDSVIQSGWSVIESDSGEAVMFRTQGQPLGEPISLQWSGWIAEQARTRLQAYHGQLSDEEAVIKAIENDRLSVMKAKERWQEATGKEACRDTFRAFYQPWRKIWTYKEDDQRDTLAATLRL